MILSLDSGGRDEQDFAEAGVELKVTPIKRTTRGYSSKERLVLNIINYMDEDLVNFHNSSFWKKNKTLLIIFYLHDGTNKSNFKIVDAVMFKYPHFDLVQVKNDWQVIVNKIRSGNAHNISEGDTSILGACTKGANKSSHRSQPYSSTTAMQRAYSLKNSYMTHIVREYIMGNNVDPNIIRDPNLL